MKFLKKILLILSLSLLPINVCGLATANALSAGPTQIVADSQADACSGLNQVSGTGCGSGQAALSKVVNGVVTIISYVAGLIAIIMIIISGIRFTTSGGDSAKVSAAKTSLIYALIGIAVAVLAQVLVHFVINEATK
jgi:hypothetical protein